VNGMVFNVIAYATVGLIILFTLASITIPLLQSAFA
jgi:hypothetical protein